jgi:integrase/recombinase XerC
MADLRAFSRWHAAHKTAGFSSTEFRAYREHLCNETGHSPATVNRRLQSLRLFGRFLHETGQLPENPTRELALLRNGNGNNLCPRTLTRGEIARLLDALRTARPSLEPRDTAIVQLMLQAGLRVHEVAALRVEDAIVAGRSARVEVRGSRQNTSRTVPLNSTAARALRDYLAVRPAIPHVDHLFLSQRGEPLSVRSVQRLVDTYARAADLRGVSAQSLRHTCAKNMLEETHDAALVARWLGHRDARTLGKYLR